MLTARYTAAATRCVLAAAPNPLTAAELASSLSCSSSTARRRLAELHAAGEVELVRSGRTVRYRLTQRDTKAQPVPVVRPEVPASLTRAELVLAMDALEDAARLWAETTAPATPEGRHRDYVLRRAMLARTLAAQLEHVSALVDAAAA